MGVSRVMKERIRRVTVLFKELGCKVEGSEVEDGVYSGSFRTDDGFEGGIILDRMCRFLEISFSFVIKEDQALSVRSKLEEIHGICYEFGCYQSMEASSTDLVFSVFSKIYYSGLSYLSLRDSLYDFMDCVDLLADLLDPATEARAARQGEEGREP